MLDFAELNPPKAESTPELDWVVRAAFAAEPPPVPAGLDLERLRVRANDLGLAERIGARRDLPELPTELADRFRAARARAAAIGLHYESLARKVADAADALETPVVFLKGLALVLSGWADPGARAFSDLDVLVPEARAHDLFNRLVKLSFRPAEAEPTEQHLPELAPPGGGSLEVHFALRGIVLADGRSAGLDDLAERDAFTRLDGFSGSAHLPTRPLAAAHVLVHGLQQHLLRPASYPLFRMIADLIDLLPNDAEWDTVLRDWHPAIEHTVSATSFETTRRLCDGLRKGQPPGESRGDQEDPDVETLFHHLVAGALDPSYGRSLRGTYRRQRMGEAFRRGELGGYLERKIRSLFRG